MPDNRVPRSAIIAAWLDHTLTAQQAAEKVGYKRRRALWVRAKALGLPPRRLGRPPIIAGSLFEAMWRAGVMSSEIARVFGGCAQPSVSQAARNAGLPPRNKGPQPGGITLEEFAEMQVWARMSRTAAAEQSAMINAEMADGCGSAGQLVGAKHARAA